MVAMDGSVQQVQMSVGAADAFSVKFQQVFTAVEKSAVALVQAAPKRICEMLSD